MFGYCVSAVSQVLSDYSHIVFLNAKNKIYYIIEVFLDTGVWPGELTKGGTDPLNLSEPDATRQKV